jgi:flagellar hook-associated protein 3 FlgL
MQQQVQHLLGIMNARDASNQYIFSGFKGDTVPFVQQGAASLGVNGSVLYQGDEGQRQVQTDSSTFVAASDSGKNLFVDIPSATNSFSTSASVINIAVPPATISAGFVYDQTLYDTFYPEDIIIEFQDPNAVGPAQSNYHVIQKSDGRVLQSNVLYTSGTAIQINGAQFTISGSPSEGDTFFVDSKNNLDMLSSINQLFDGLVNLPTGSASLQPLLDNSLTYIDSAQNSILQARADIGGRLNSLDNTKAQHADMDLASKKLLSEIEDVDYNEAISRLSFQSFVLQAAQQSFAKISNLSLFDKI